MKKIVILIAVCLLVSSAPAMAKRDFLSDPDMKKYAKTATDLGWKYSAKGEYSTAMDRFGMAMKHDSRYAPAYFGMAYVQGLLGRLDESIANYRETIKRDPRHVMAHANLGFSLLQKKEPAEALKELYLAVRLNPRCVEAHTALAGYYMEKGEWSRAAGEANLVTKYGGQLDPDFRKVIESHGQILY